MGQPLPLPRSAWSYCGHCIGRADRSADHSDRGENGLKEPANQARDQGWGTAALHGHLGGCLEDRPIEPCFVTQMEFGRAAMVGRDQWRGGSNVAKAWRWGH